MLNGKILVERVDKIHKKANGSPFTQTVVSNNLGTVKFSNNPDLPEGCQVYFGSTLETINVNGTEVMAMEASNVIAKVLEPSDGQSG